MSAQTSAAGTAREQKYPLPVPEPDLTPQQLIARATALIPRLRETQDEDDARGCHSEAMETEFRRAGFYRILQPRMFGGYAFGYPTFYRVMVEIAKGNPGVGWCLALAATHGLLIASHWPERAQFELFGGHGDLRAPHRVNAIRSSCVRADGGYVVDGIWNYCSGIPYATHFIANVPLKEGDAPPVNKIFVVPRAQYKILDDWGGDATLGMRASGSNSVQIDKAFVPEHLVIDAKPGLWANAPMDGGTPGTRLHGDPLYLGRMIAPYHMSLVAPVLGAARAALDEFEEKVFPRQTYHPPFMPRVRHFDFQRPFGQAMALTDSAEALLFDSAEKQMAMYRRWQADGTPMTLEEQVRLFGVVQTAGRMACEAVELLFHNASSASSKKGNRMERYFRDVAMYRGHMSSQYMNLASGIARVHTGQSFGWGGL